MSQEGKPIWAIPTGIHITSAEFYPFLCHFLRLYKNGNNTKYSSLTIAHGEKEGKKWTSGEILKGNHNISE